MSRREFTRLTAASAALALTSLAGCATSSETNSTKQALVGSNIYGWGQYAQRENRKLDPCEVMTVLKDCGYDYLEGFMDLQQPGEITRFADQMRARGLRPISLYTGARLHESDKASDTVKNVLAAAEVAAKSGFEIISCNPQPIGREKTEAELRTQVAALSELGEGLHNLGLKLGIHHHLPEMASGAREFHFNFQHTSPDLVGWCYDVHWVWKGGLMPLDALSLYGNRIVTWHLRQSRDKVWWEDLDTGDIDYSAVAAFARQKRLPRRFTVELALEPGTRITRSVVENHRRSREFVRRVFGA